MFFSLKILNTALLSLILSWSLSSSAQYDEDTDPNFDPFSDYSETDQTIDEEADIYFFRNGRLVTMNLQVGMRHFTGTLARLYTPALAYGLGLTYFFDMRFAGHLAFSTSDHAYGFSTQNGSVTGNVGTTFLSFDLKYFLNTDHLIRPVADLNPYWLVGFNQTYRTLRITGFDEASRDSALGLNLGAGIEKFILRRRAYVGFQVVYRYFNFRDETQFLIDPGSLNPVDIKPSGDAFDYSFIMGLNF